MVMALIHKLYFNSTHTGKSLQGKLEDGGIKMKKTGVERDLRTGHLFARANDRTDRLM